MESESRQAHWENVYARKGENEVSWFQENPAPSLELIAEVGAAPDAAIIDSGGGASRLVDHLIEKGFQDVTVLDLSGSALEAAKTRLRDRSPKVHLESVRATLQFNRKQTIEGDQNDQQPDANPEAPADQLLLDGQQRFHRGCVDLVPEVRLRHGFSLGFSF
jgi:hypothetical protein